MLLTVLFVSLIPVLDLMAQKSNEYGIAVFANYPFVSITGLQSIVPIEYQGNASPGFKLFYVNHLNDLISANIEFGMFREIISEKTTVETIESIYVEGDNIIEVRRKSELTEKTNSDAFEFLASIHYRLGYFSQRLESISVESGLSYSKLFKINYRAYNSSAFDNDLLLKNSIEEHMLFFNAGIRFETDIMKGRNLGVYIRHFTPLKINISSTNQFIGQFDSGRVSKIRFGFFISID